MSLFTVTSVRLISGIMLTTALFTCLLGAAVLGGSSSTNAVNSVAAIFGVDGQTGGYGLGYGLGYGSKTVGFYGLGYGPSGYGAGNDLDVGGYGLGYGFGYGGYTGYGPGLGGYGLPYGVNAYKYGVSVPVSGTIPRTTPWGTIRGFNPSGYGSSSTGFKSSAYGPGLYSSAFYR